MLKRIGTLILLMAIVVALPSTSHSAPHPRKYGIELQVGGNYSLLSEVNDFVHTELVNYNPAIDEMNIGAQFGLGIIYRQEKNFGWNIGYNRLMEINKYRASTFIVATDESWSEQTVTGSEIYAMATWYMSKWGGELSFGLGPAFYNASFERVNDIVRTPGQHLPSGITDAKGKSMGMVGAIGFELALRDKVGLLFQLGGRMAKVDELLWENPDNAFGDKEVVYYNADLGDKQEIDFTGAYLKVGLRMYFEQATDWRH